jgi:DNA invertase Pin-like site-specific DNA recombinase
VRQFVAANAGRLVASYTEKDDAEAAAAGPQLVPQLVRAIEEAKRVSATLVIAEVGRLSRNAAVTDLLWGAVKGGLQFVCCDMPNVNHLTIHILAATAQDLSQQVRQRTRNSLAVAKANGVKLGSNREGHWKGRERGWRQAVAASTKMRKTRAAEAYQFLLPEIKARREHGDTLPEIINWLNANNHTTTAGMPFTQTALWRIIKRYLGTEYLGNNTRKFARV